MDGLSFPLVFFTFFAAFAPFLVAAVRTARSWWLIGIANIGVFVAGHTLLKFLADSAGETIGFSTAFDAAIRLTIIAMVWCALLVWSSISRVKFP